jgi:hypothetical protein
METLLDRRLMHEDAHLGRRKPPSRVARLTASTLDQLEEIALAFGIGLAEYVDQITAATRKRDLPEAKKILADMQKARKRSLGSDMSE